MTRYLALLALTLPLATAAPPERLKALILSGESDILYHDWRESTPALKSMLEATGRFEIKVLEQVRGAGPDTFAPYDVLILNYNGPRWGERTEKAVEDFVRAGKGFVSFHGASYGPLCGMEFDPATRRWRQGKDQAWSAYFGLIGARWLPDKIGHGKRHVFKVSWTDREHPVSRGLAPDFLANDELYHRLDLLPETKVLATAFDDPETGGTGRDEPIIWTSAFGAGRTLHLTLGHDLSAMAQPGFRAAFARGVEWAASGAVTLPPEIPSTPRAQKPVRILAVTGGHPYPTGFYTLFEGYDDIVWSHATTPAEAFRPDLAERYDVIVLHDMWQDLAPEFRERLSAFVRSGKGVISVHHAIVDYTAWPWWWREVIGGQYFVQAQPGRPASEYREGVEMIATPTELGASHPVTRGVGPLVVNDEAYRGMWHSPRIRVLMETRFELNDTPVVYLGPDPKLRAVYIQLGHSDSTLRHPAYRKLVHNAILWGAGRVE